ncbi:MAG: ester cyclase [Chloroflexota bacterium]|nr:ester cyclase [Chloroflexota bacterium]
MSIEANKAIVRRLYDEFWNAEQLQVADELYHPDYVFDEGYGAGAPSVAAMKEGVLFWHRVLHDMHFTIDDMIAEGETVVVRWTARGTHQGDWEMELGTIPASGKATTTPGTSTIYLRDGKIIRGENHIDFVSLLKQMGARVMPAL